jgi:hypothetical protein
MLPALPLVLRIKAKMDKGIVPLARFHDDIAAIATISSGRPTPGFKRLTPESDAPVAAVSGFNSNFCLIDKHKSGSSLQSA